MERASFLFKAGAMSLLSGAGILIITANQQQFIPYMIACAGLSIYAGIKCFVAASVLRDEEEERIEGDY